MPHMCWVVTASTALVAMAASTALPAVTEDPDPGTRRQMVDRAHHAAAAERRRERHAAVGHGPKVVR